jgi:hypothetical protein
MRQDQRQSYDHAEADKQESVGGKENCKTTTYKPGVDQSSPYSTDFRLLSKSELLHFL